ncbi:kinase-like domain-containing protein [Gigaspora rosea]|uniref:Kinase-like domain-containing protein n=1 Tax=Gigaspora rosea TaxID=44941 RepID=A0A397VZN5_9GLOM|nr:kinase-like domain-containing protein [Gigaspora rosea]
MYKLIRLIFLFHFSDRNSLYGKCMQCNENNTHAAWRQTCDPDKTIREWTSGNKVIDRCIKEFQIKTTKYENMIEWIPFDKLTDISEIGKGGFGSVHQATWLDGIRKIKKVKIVDSYDGDDDNYFYIRDREQSSIVALKTLPSSLNEFKNHMKCTTWGSKLKIYGLTYDEKTDNYLMVFQYANNGSLNKYLETNFKELTWKTKLKLLLDISEDLREIHYAGYIHADFHSGNVLQDQRISEIMQSYIADLGLSKKTDENSSDGIYGVIPYVAPEVLLGEKFTPAADVYGFGIIMTEMSTGQRPFDGYEFDTKLTNRICKGLRPEFAIRTPSCYVELARRCMNSDPKSRPTANEVYMKLYKWNKFMKVSDDADVDKIKKQFLDADKIVKTLPIISRKHPNSMYSSKFINTREILKSSIEGTLILHYTAIIILFIYLS